MNLHDGLKKIELRFHKTPLVWLLAVAAGVLAIHQTKAATNVVIWDTSVHFSDSVDVANKSGWKAVPTDLLTLEANPPKASSDPGYYGREYSFNGDAVVENQSLIAVFWSAKGKVILYSKGTLPDGASSGNSSPGKKILEFVPLQTKNQATRIRHCGIVRNAADEAALEVSFSASSSPEASAVFVFGKSEIVEVKPAATLKGISVMSPIQYGVVPSFIGDDLIFSPPDDSSMQSVSLPSENVFLGLLEGENNMFVMTWPKGTQQIQLSPGKEKEGKHLIESVDFQNDGQSLYLAPLQAHGIWHREELKPSYLEKDTAITWKRPFPAKWKTQLYEADVKTTFTFRESKGQVWRGVPGSYSYPVWFSGDDAFYHLSKKVPPQGESLVYFVDGQNTPLLMSTPVDIMKATLGRQLSDAILDIGGRKLHTHHRRGATGVRRACTCGCTEAIQAFFEAGEEVAKRNEIKEAVDDMIFFVERHMERIDEYRRFADDTIKFLRAKAGSSTDLKPFVENLEPIAQQIPSEYAVQKENMKSLEYAAELSRQTIALTGKHAPENLKAYMDLLKAWRAMGGAQDYLVAQCHGITRKLAQQAGYACADQPKAVQLAQEIRARCKKVLRNPDGYEIWAEYN